MSTKGRPNFFDTFEPNRVEQGEAISRIEMIRRLAHYLQVPQRFGYRLLLAFEDVIEDALQHGEGIKIKNAGTLTLQEHKNKMYTGFGKTEERKVLFKYDFQQSKEAKRFLVKISKLFKEDKLDGYFQNPKDN